MWIYRKVKRYRQTGAETSEPFFVYEVGYMQLIQDGYDGHVQEFRAIEEYENLSQARGAVCYLNGGQDDVKVEGIIFDKP